MPRRERKTSRRPGTSGAREFRWIRWLRRRQGSPPPGVAVGIGDDAAVWRPSPGRAVVLSVDAHVDGVHFQSAWLRPREIGRRAVAAAVSDLAAMASRPRLVLVAATFPAAYPESSFRELERGIEAEVERYDAAIVGGNISAGALALSITAIGDAEPSKVVTRGGARVGDGLWVTGTPGLAGLGYALLAGEVALAGSGRASRAARAAERAYRAPRARVAEAMHLARSWPLDALIDVSDGLYADVGHILEESARSAKVAVELEESALVELPFLASLAEATGRPPPAIVLAPSDDYELCFAARPHAFESRRARAFQQRFGVALTRVGRLVAGGGIYLRGTDGKRRRAKGRGWEH